VAPADAYDESRRNASGKQRAVLAAEANEVVVEDRVTFGNNQRVYERGY